MRRTDTDCTEPNQTGSAFVSTTSREAVVMRMARGRLRQPQAVGGERRVWIYTIRADGRFFGTQRSLQRAMDRMEDCDITPELQARLNTLDSLINVARGEAEWVAYRYIPPRLIHHETQYRLSADGQQMEEIPGTRRDNPTFVSASTNANAVAWLVDAIARPARSYAYRAYNQLNVATMNAVERVRNGTFGAQFCTAGCLSSVRSDSTRSERGSGSAPPTDQEVQAGIDAMVQKVLAQELHDVNTRKLCVLPELYDSSEPTSSSHSGTCEAPEAFNLDGMVPNGFVWIDGHLAETAVPWASWYVDRGGWGRKKRPVYCDISIRSAVYVSCQQNPYFTEFYVVLRGYSGRDRFDAQVPGSTVTPVAVKPVHIPMEGAVGRVLADIARGNRGRLERLIQEVFNSRYWNTSIIVAPVYIPPRDPHPPEWREELR